MLKRSDVVRAGGVGLPGVRSCEDWDLYARMIQQGMVFKGVRQVFSSYLQRENALSRDIESMLREKLAMQDRLIRRYRDSQGESSLDSADLFGKYRNGYVLFALGQGVGQRLDIEVLRRLTANMIVSDMHFRFFCDQFLHGLQHGMSIKPVMLDARYIDEVCSLVSTDSWRRDSRDSGLFAKEIRREMGPATRKDFHFQADQPLIGSGAPFLDSFGCEKE